MADRKAVAGNGFIASVGSARFSSGVSDLIYSPANRVYKNPVVYCHGLGDSATGVNAAPETRRRIKAFTSQGHTVCVPEFGSQWGNSTSMTRITEAVTYHRANLNGSNGKIFLSGSSMGSLASLNYAYFNPTLVAGVIGFIPAPNPQALRDSPIFGPFYRPTMDPAYGITYPTPLPTGYVPYSANNMAVLQNVPILLFYSVTDGVSENIREFAAGTGAEIYNVGNNGHSFATIDQAKNEIIVDFIRRNA